MIGPASERKNGAYAVLRRESEANMLEWIEYCIDVHVN